MTSPSAQKAAGEIAKLLTGRDDTPLGLPTSIIQQSITEAVDAAVAPKDKRVKELEAALGRLINIASQNAMSLSQFYVRERDSEEWGMPQDIGEAQNALFEARSALEAPHEP